MFDVGNATTMLQVLVFYPCDWNTKSASLLSSFSSLTEQFTGCGAQVVGVSTDSVASHRAWAKETQGLANFPLVADPSGTLANRFHLYDRESQECLPGVVILDSHGTQLEVVQSSLEGEELAAYTLDLAWKTKANEEFKTCDLSNYVQQIDKQLRSSRGVPTRVFRDASRSRFLKRGDRDASKARSRSQDPTRMREISRTVDRLSRGFLF